MSEKTYRPISELHEWDKNPKDIKAADLAELKERLKLGQFRPLLVMKDGTVVGGNQRLKAYREMGIESVWTSEIEFLQVGDVWSVQLDGVLVPDVSFPSKDQAMFVYAMADNEKFGSNLRNKVIELAKEVRLDPARFRIKIDFGKGTTIGDLLNKKEEAKSEVKFTEELLESHNFVVLYFDNDIDWTHLQSLYPLPTVKSLDSKVGFEKSGIGRVVRGVDFIKKIRGEV